MHFAARSLAALLFASVAAAGCSSGESPTAASGSGGAGASGAGTGGEPDAGAIGGDRPVEVFVPASVKPGVPAPLVILLHGYSVSGAVQELYLQLAPIADARGFLFAHPDGTIDQDAKYFWNATDACCNFYGSDIDDSAYLSALIDEIKSRFDVDPKRVYLVGHSNGGYMSYRMACDHADQIAGIASIAGAMWLDVSKCKPSGPVSVLQIHGTADDTVLFDGDVDSPSASTSVADWATFNGCSPDPTMGGPLDLDPVLDGDETQVTSYKDGCKGGSAAELWAIQGGTHLPNFSTDAKLQMIDFLLAHPKP